MLVLLALTEMEVDAETKQLRCIMLLQWHL